MNDVDIRISEVRSDNSVVVGFDVEVPAELAEEASEELSRVMRTVTESLLRLRGGRYT